MKESEKKTEGAALLAGKTAAVTGATGGLGRELCRQLLGLGAGLILLTRNREKTEMLMKDLRQEFPGARLFHLQTELTDPGSVRRAWETLGREEPDFLILNAGIYHVSRTPCVTGFDPVFQTNFLSQYALARNLLPVLSRKKGKIVAVGSIAHRDSATDPSDPDFARRRSPEAVYGNSKRHLMFALTKLAEKNPDVQLAVAHPGISPTGITSHYPKALQTLIRLPMKLMFLPASKAAENIVQAVCREVPLGSWIGPGTADIWGRPKVSPFLSGHEAEAEQVWREAEALCRKFSAESAGESTAACGREEPTAAGAGDCG